MKYIILAMSFISLKAGANNPYEQIMICDGGAAVVDKNLLSPRWAQVVIRNQNIVKYLESMGIPANSRREIILVGENDIALNNKNDFHGFRSAATLPPYDQNSNDWVSRNNHELRISFNRRIIPNNSDCGRDIPSSDPYCQGRWSEVAEWNFKNCQ